MRQSQMGVINMQILQASRCELSVTMITTAISKWLYMRNKSAATSTHSKSICLMRVGKIFANISNNFLFLLFFNTVFHVTKLYIDPKALCQLSCHKTKMLHLWPLHQLSGINLRSQITGRLRNINSVGILKCSEN